MSRIVTRSAARQDHRVWVVVDLPIMWLLPTQVGLCQLGKIYMVAWYTGNCATLATTNNTGGQASQFLLLIR